MLLNYRLIKAGQIEDFARPFWWLFPGDSDKAINTADRKILCSHSRRIYENLGPVKTAVEEKAMYSVGRHWQPVYSGLDPVWGQEASDWLKDFWYPICNLLGEELDFQTSLYVTSKNLDVYGEFFWYLTEYEDTGWPAVQLIAPHKIDQPRASGWVDDHNKLTKKAGAYVGCKIIGGVVKNRQGRPIAFCFQGDAQDGSKDTFISADSLIRVREIGFGDETRSVPATSHGINQGRSMISGIENEQAFLEAAGRLALLEYNDIGGLDPNDPQNAIATRPGPPTDLGDGTSNPGNNPNGQNRVFTEEWNQEAQTRYFRSNSGGKVEAFQFERPAGAWGDFQDRLCRYMVDPIWPYMLVNKEQELGGANCRAMIARANRLVQDRQDLLRRVARKAIQYAVAKGSKIGRLKSSDHWWDWNFSMPARITVDFGRDSKAEVMEIGEEILDPAEVVEGRGVGDYKEFVTRLYRNQAIKLQAKQQVEKEFGVSLTDPAAPQVGGGMGSGSGSSGGGTIEGND